MVYRSSIATLLVVLSASSVSAGLQSALSASLRLPAFIDPFEWPIEASELDDALFVDPVASTFDEPAYGNGPELRYNSATGDVEISAPPMLGPADEFGQRSRYTPTQITFYDSGHRSGDPRLPAVTIHLRNALEGEGLPSFVESPTGGLTLYAQDQSVQISSLDRSGWGGAAVEMDEWLSPLLAEELFVPSPPPVATDPYHYHHRRYEPLAEIEAIVDYENFTDRYSLSHLRSLRIRAARALEIESDAQELPVPEPSGLAVVFLASGTLLARRRVS